MLYNYLKFVLIIASLVFIFENKALKFSAVKFNIHKVDERLMYGVISWFWNAFFY